MVEEAIDASGSYGAISSVDSGAAYPVEAAPVRQADAPVPVPEVSTPPPGTMKAATTARASTASQPSSQDIQAAVDRANANLAAANRVVEFRVDPATGLSVAMIRDTQTGVIVQQIPGTDVIALARMLADWSPGKHIMLDLIA